MKRIDVIAYVIQKRSPSSWIKKGRQRSLSLSGTGVRYPYVPLGSLLQLRVHLTTKVSWGMMSQQPEFSLRWARATANRAPCRPLGASRRGQAPSGTTLSLDWNFGVPGRGGDTHPVPPDPSNDFDSTPSCPSRSARSSPLTSPAATGSPRRRPGARGRTSWRATETAPCSAATR